MSQGYNLNAQRNGYMISLRNDIMLKEYPKSDHKTHFDQYAAKKIFKDRWNSIMFRILFSVSLPFILLFFNIFSPIKYTVKYLGRKRIDVDGIHRIFLNNDSNLYRISKRIAIQKDSDYWFKSFSDNFTLPKEYKVVSIEDLVTIPEILKCSFQAFIIQIQTIAKFGYDKLFLSYNAYNWCLCDFALRHLPLEAELIHCSIYDRMAIMYDLLPNSKKILLQHGGMFMRHKIIKDSPYYDWHDDMNFYTISGFYKSSPSKVYCLSENDKIALSRSVIANSPEYNNIGYGFGTNLTPSRKSVLIVGNYNLHFKDEVFIINELSHFDIEVFLKNHPVIDDSLYDEIRKSAKNLHFIDGKSHTYPNVDLVISYDSTLAYEYESIGTRVLFYEDINISDVKEYVIKALEL